MKKKLLSIVIPVFNNPLIDRALNSLIRYKREEVEVIVVDGKSSDETVSIINKYKDIVDVFISESDCGPYDAANKGINIASGEWIFWFAADDILINDPIDIIKRYDSDCSDVICGSIIKERCGGESVLCKSEDNLNRLYYHCSLRQPATFFRKKIICEYKYNIDYKYAADRELFLRLMTAGVKIKIIEDAIVFFSYGGLTTSKRVVESYKEDYRISQKYGANKILAFTLFEIRMVQFYIKNIFTKLKGGLSE